MTKTHIVAAVVTTVTVVVAAASWIQVLGSEIALFERFPNIDQDVIVKAHRKIVLSALTGSDVRLQNCKTDEDFDAVFFDVIANLK